MKIRLSVLHVLVVAAALPGVSAHADIFHYKNVLMGDRAMGMGGAFTAVADDASGLVYNPAGLAFALSNDISGSANAFYKKKITYKKALGNSDFTEHSEGSLAPFFGGLQKVDNIAPGVAAAFGLFNTDSELTDQDDNISDPSILVNRYHRTKNLRAATSGYGVAFAQRLVSSFAMGISITYLTLDELLQEYQDADTVTTSVSGATVRQILAQNIRQRLKASAIEIGVGLQWAMTPKISLGLNLKIPTMISQSFEQGFEQTINETANNTTWSFTYPRAVVDQFKNDNPLGSWPSEYRFGFAYFVSTSLLVTSDVMHYTATEGDRAEFKRDAVTNYALGVEYFVAPPLPLRFGYFTNNDSRSDVKDGETGQRDHIDYDGFSIFLAWVQPNSQIAIGSVIQNGKGRAQKLQNSSIQDVEAQSVTVALSATHNF